MAAQQEAKLNLVLSATDTASKVIEEFGKNLRSTFENLGNIAKEAFNFTPLEEAVRKGILGIDEELKKLNFKPMAEEVEAVARLINEELNRINFTPLAEEANKAATQINESLKKINFEPLNKNAVSSFRELSQAAADATRSTSADLDTVAKQMKNVSDQMDKMAGKSGELKKSLDFANLQMAGQMLEDFGRRGVEFFAECIKSAADFDQGIHNTIASMVAMNPNLKNTGQIFDDLKQKALDLGSSGFFSANEVAEGMNVLAKQGIEGANTLKAAIQTVHDVAAANQESLIETANVVTDIYHEFGDQLKQQFGSNVKAAFESIGNIMTSTLHHARLSMTDFLTTLRYVGPVASSAGWSLRDVGEATALLAQHGIRGSQAGTTLRRMIVSLTPATKKAAAEMEKLGIITKDQANQFFTADGKAKPFAQILEILHNTIGKLNPQMQTMAVKTLFSMYAMSGVTAIAGTTKKQFDELTKTFGQSNVVSQALQEKQRGLGFVLQQLSATFETFKKAVGETFDGLVAKVAPALEAIMRFFIHLPTPVKNAIVAFGAITAVVSVLGGAFLAAVGTIGMFAESFAAGLAVLGEIAVPVAIVTGAIAAVIAIIAALAFAWNRDLGHIREVTKPVLDFLRTQFNAAMKEVSQTVGNAVKGLKQWWDKIEPDVSRAMGRVLAVIVKLKPLWEALWTAFKSTVQNAWNFITSFIQHGWGVISGIFQLGVHLINGQWSKVWQDLKQIVVNGLKMILDVIKTNSIGKALIAIVQEVAKFCTEVSKDFDKFYNDHKKSINEFWQYVTKLWNDGLNSIKSVVKDLENVFKDIGKALDALSKGDIKGFWDNTKKAFSDGGKTVTDLIKGLLTTMDNLFGQLPSKALRWATNQMNSFVSGLKSGASRVTSQITSLIHSIESYFAKLPGEALRWASNMMSMFASGVEAGIGRIKDKVLNLTSWIKDNLGHFSPAKAGYLKDDDKWFPRAMQMWAEGIENNRPKIQQAVKNVALDVKNKLDMAPTTNQATNTPSLVQKLVSSVQKAVSVSASTLNTTGLDPFRTTSNSQYDRVQGHTPNASTTTSLYDRVLGHNPNRPTELHIHIEGRSAETDRQLVNKIQEQIERQFRTHLPMQVTR